MLFILYIAGELKVVYIRFSCMPILTFHGALLERVVRRVAA